MGKTSLVRLESQELDELDKKGEVTIGFSEGVFEQGEVLPLFVGPDRQEGSKVVISKIEEAINGLAMVHIRRVEAEQE
ncbi:hypothetical protein ACFL3C_01385 [Patescibacteria group bacterium]